MKFRTAGTDWNPIPLPFFEGEGGGGGDGGDPNGNGDGGNEGDGSPKFDAGTAYAALDADPREWLQKAEVESDPVALAKKAYNQEKMLGSAIRIPGKDAPQEEKDAYLNKLGRPESADKYELTVPKDMPEGLPYDGEFAKAAAAKAHALGLTQEQFAGLHDLFVQTQVEGFKGLTAQQEAAMTERATKAGEALEKLWGPLDGATAKANLELADQVFTQTKGGDQFLDALKELGLVKDDKTILDARVAPFIAAIGTALYTEDGVLRGNPDVVGNPFADGESFNITEQMALVKKDPAKARSLIAAAGKKLEDFGLKA